MANIVVGLYNQLEDAQDAVSELVSAGFPREDISMVAADTEGKFQTYVGGSDAEAGEGIAAGAGAGAVVGGIGGLLVGIGALAIPGIGPVLAAGPLASALIGAGVGAATGGLLGALVDAGIPEEEANVYAEGVRRGGTLIKVTTSADRVDEANRILDRFNPIDIDQRATTWRSENWSRFDPDATPYTQTDFERERSRFGEDVGMRADYDDYDPLFRTHYQTTYGTTGRAYEDFRPAYYYGHDLAGNPQYRDKTWEQVEMDARSSWEREHNDTLWDDIKDAVREGWMRVTGQRY